MARVLSGGSKRRKGIWGLRCSGYSSTASCCIHCRMISLSWIQASRCPFTHCSVVSRNSIRSPSGPVTSWWLTKVGPRAGSKSVDLGRGSMYRAGAISAGGTFFKVFLGTLRSGVARELSATPAGLVAALDSRFFNDSFLVRFSRAMTPVSSSAEYFRAFVSGFKGDDTAGM